MEQKRTTQSIKTQASNTLKTRVVKSQKAYSRKPKYKPDYSQKEW
jgi:hypothetical protein